MSDANLTPDQEAEVRRLMAEARHTDPMPEPVAARLDRVLAQLAEGDGSHDPARIDELASRRRRKASTLLVAAAAIVAVGVGLGQVVDRTGHGATSADTATSGGRAPSGNAAAVPEAASGATSMLQKSSLQDAPQPLGVLVEVRSHRFTTDLRRAGVMAGVRLHTGLLQQAAEQAFGRLDEAFNLAVPGPSAAPSMAPFASTPDTTDSASSSGGGGADGSSAGDRSATTDDSLTTMASGEVGGHVAASTAYDCPPAAYGAGRKVAVLYDGEPAVLVFRRPTGDTRIVDLLECGTADVLRSVTLAR